jgi:protein-tyrosine phosphatase
MKQIRSHLCAFVMLGASLAGASNTQAVETASVVRVDDQHVAVQWQARHPVSLFVAPSPNTPVNEARRIMTKATSTTVLIDAAIDAPRYFILKEQGTAKILRVAERVLPLQQASNFRDVGGYPAANGQHVKWGRVFRSGAMPMLTEKDAELIQRLGIKTIVDLRSLDEREIAPDTIDDRIGALFVSNDYRLKALLQNAQIGGGEYMYRGTGKALAPQFRSIFRQLLANDGAILYHCSAGQDRTGVATALILSALGVDRKTVLADYHLSTSLRRPEYEMPKLDLKDWPGNAIAPYYAAIQSSPTPQKAEPLYTKSGASHLAQFFEVIDREYGSIDAYLAKELGITKLEIEKLQKHYLE